MTIPIHFKKRLTALTALLILALSVLTARPVLAAEPLGDTYEVRAGLIWKDTIPLNTGASEWKTYGDVYKQKPAGGSYLTVTFHYESGSRKGSLLLYYTYTDAADTIPIRKHFIDTTAPKIMAGGNVQFIKLADKQADISYTIYPTTTAMEEKVKSSETLTPDAKDGYIALDNYAEDPDYAQMSADDQDMSESTGGGAVADFVWRVIKVVLGTVILQGFMAILYLISGLADVLLWFMTNMFFSYFSPVPTKFVALITTDTFNPLAIAQALGYSILIIIFAYEMTLYLTGPMFRKEESIMSILGRTVMAIILTGNAHLFLNEFSDMALKVWDTFRVNRAQVLPATPNLMKMTIGSFSFADAVLAAPLIIYFVMLIMIVVDMFKLFLETVERWILLGVTYTFAPIFMPTIAGTSTMNIFKSYVKMFISELIIVAMNLWFIYAINLMLDAGYSSTHGIVETALATLSGDSGQMVENGSFSFVVYLAMVDGLIKVAQRIDQYLNDVGFSVARTGGQLATAVALGLGKMASAATSVATKTGAGVIGRHKAATAATTSASMRGVSPTQLRQGQDFLKNAASASATGKAGKQTASGAVDTSPRKNSASPYAGMQARYSPAAVQAAYDSGIDSSGNRASYGKVVSGQPVENALRGMKNSATGQSFAPAHSQLTAAHDLESGRISFSMQQLDSDGNPTGRITSGNIYSDPGHGGTAFTGADGHEYWAVPNRGSDPIYPTAAEVMDGMGGRMDAADAHDISGGSYAFSAEGLSRATGQSFEAGASSSVDVGATAAGGGQAPLGSVFGSAGASAPNTGGSAEPGASGNHAPVHGQAFLESMPDGTTAIYGSETSTVPLAAMGPDIAAFGALNADTQGVSKIQDGLGESYSVRSAIQDGQTPASFEQAIFSHPEAGKYIPHPSADEYTFQNSSSFAADGYAVFQEKTDSTGGSPGANGYIAFNPASGYKVMPGDVVINLNGGVLGLRQVTGQKFEDATKTTDSFREAARKAADRRRR